MPHINDGPGLYCTLKYKLLIPLFFLQFRKNNHQTFFPHTKDTSMTIRNVLQISRNLDEESNVKSEKYAHSFAHLSHN